MDGKVTTADTNYAYAWMDGWMDAIFVSDLLIQVYVNVWLRCTMCMVLEVVLVVGCIEDFKNFYHYGFFLAIFCFFFFNFLALDACSFFFGGLFFFFFVSSVRSSLVCTYYYRSY